MKKNLLTSVAAVLALLVSVPVSANVGGPDSYGYTWIDSNEPGGPVYNWIEIATPAGGSGTYRSAINCDDCHEAGIPVGFNFPFYGTPFNTVSIGSNGVVYFENVYLGLSNSCIPGTPSYTMTQYNFIAHLWDDLAPNYQGGIYTQAFPNYFVIEYYDIVPCCSAGDGDTWQVILFRNGNILMQYKELSNQGVQTDFTVGIQNDPATGLQYVCDATGIPLASGRAILFSPPTFSCSSVSQNILGPNTGFCPSASVALNAGGTSISQTWSTAATTSTISVNTVGNYSIIALDTNGCTIRDTVGVTAYSLPTVALGADFTQCNSAILDAGNAGANFLWSDNSTAQTLTVTASGTYSVVVTDAVTGCSNNDDINVTINPSPVVALGTDITQCGGTALLDAGNAGANFLWSDNSTAQTLSVNVSGTYSVIVTDPSTLCSATDDIVVTINPVPVVNLGTDITQCGGTAMLDAGNAGANFLWSDNSTAQMLTVSASGIYFVAVTDAVTGCSNNDTISVTINTIPTVALGADITQCGGTALLDAGNAGANFLWSDNSTAQTLAVNASGIYSVTVTDATTGCNSGDTVMVTINPNPVVALGNDITQCGGTATLDAGNAGANYLWSDNSTTQQLTVSASGVYSVIVTDATTGCTGNDTISVTINQDPTVTFTLANTTACVDDGAMTLAGGSPAGGTYSGTGVSAGMFDPGTGVGSYTITYTYTDPNTNCSNAATQSITVNACTGITELNGNSVRIYPNPTSGLLNIETLSMDVMVEVYNTLGELVASEQVNSGTAKIDLGSKENGIYFVRITTANGSRIEKIVLQR